MYEQTLYKVLDDHIKPHTIDKNNKAKKWEYGYNEDYDVVIISKTGEIGEIYEIQNLKIALPKAKKVHKFENKKWTHMEYPKELSKIKSVFDWEEYPLDFKEKWYDYIDEEFNRREQGFWFYNKNVATYLTGSHYMYLQWSKIDVGQPDFRESNRLFYIFWEACKADSRCYGMCYLKNRRSGFSFMASGETVTQATISTDSRFGILSKSGPDAKKMFTDKVVPISVNYPFSLSQYKTVWTGQKQSLHIVYPLQSIRDESWKQMKSYKTYRDSILPSTGKTLETIVMTVKN